MSIDRPYKRTFRQHVRGSYTSSKYMLHPKYAKSPSHYIRAFLLLQKDIQSLFDYVEPADINQTCYSYRIHSLLLRACVEVEANCKAILKENGYSKKGDMNMRDYKKINHTHRLSSYEVKIPYWTGTRNIRTPFSNWATDNPLPWYEAYNATKHDRLAEFGNATFEHLLDACCGVLVMLSAQFKTNDFATGNVLIALEGSSDGINDGMESGIGDYFKVKFPNDWPEEIQYDFDWNTIMDEADPFQRFDYTSIK